MTEPSNQHYTQEEIKRGLLSANKVLEEAYRRKAQSKSSDQDFWQAIIDKLELGIIKIKERIDTE